MFILIYKRFVLMKINKKINYYHWLYISEKSIDKINKFIIINDIKL